MGGKKGRRSKDPALRANPKPTPDGRWLSSNATSARCIGAVVAGTLGAKSRSNIDLNLVAVALNCQHFAASFDSVEGVDHVRVQRRKIDQIPKFRPALRRDCSWLDRR